VDERSGGTTVSRRAPTPRREAFDIYWKFAAERQSIFERRWRGDVHPWTLDPILQTYKFCNVFRAADRVSQYLIRDIAYGSTNTDASDLAFEIVAFRTFSKIETWQSLRTILGRSPRLEDLRDGSFESALSEIRQAQGGLYTGAFILCATAAYGRTQKHLNHVELFKDMFLHNHFDLDLSAAKSLKEVYLLIHKYPLMGDFMSYQTAIDLNYSPLINFSENDFTQPGPGALRGLKKVFEDPGDYTASDLIHWMVDRQEVEMDRLGLDFNGLFGRRLHAIDAQNLLCETDKYCREALPELTSSRTRIKAKFTSTPEPIDYLFPPKWGIEPENLAASALGEWRTHADIKSAAKELADISA
jgi:hypothetical protein